ncbi:MULTISPECIES: hypothetical protein [unclassified Streptomyces]|uniref:hypothetical protein n=1 Tax=unclassified Streptomyces TaxID=2593676 RepID=UPI0038092B28
MIRTSDLSFLEGLVVLRTTRGGARPFGGRTVAVTGAGVGRVTARTGYDSQQTDRPATADGPHDLWMPLDGPDGRDHGDFHAEYAGRSPCTALARHPVTVASAVGASVVGASALAARALRAGATKGGDRP